MLILIGVLVLFFGYFGIRFWLLVRDLNPAPTQKINDSVYCVKDDYVNVYFFRSGADYVMVDAGVDPENLKKGMDTLGIDPGSVSVILLTHTDSDHISAMSLFPKARVYMHRDEEQMVNGKNGKFFFIRTHWKYQPYLLLNDRDSLSFGNLKIQIIHTPGHSPGSCCWMMGTRYLCTGDNISWKDGHMQHFPDFANMDTPRQEESIALVPEMKTAPVLLTAHHGIITRP